MTPREQQIEERLTAGDKPAPPAGLADRIKADIPEPASLPAPPPPATPRRAYWLLAASLAIAAVGIVVIQNLDTSLTPAAERAADEIAPTALDAATAGEEESAPAIDPAVDPSPGAEPEPSGLGGRFAEPTPEDQTPRQDAALSKEDAERRRAGAETRERSAAERDDLLDRLRIAAPAAPAAPKNERDDAHATVADSEVAVGALETASPTGAASAQPSRERLADKKAAAPPPVGKPLGPPLSESPRPEGRAEVPKPLPEVELEPRSQRLAIAEGAAAAPSERMRRIPIPDPTPDEPEPSPPPASTGGSAEPNDQPYGDTFFKSYGVNPFIDTEDDRFSTFGLDVDSGSYGLLRSYLEAGHLPPPEALRVEEIVNYFDYGDPPPSRGDFALVAEGATAPFADGPRYRLVRFGLRARDVADAERKPATLVFVVDVSGSMGRENRLGLVQRSLQLLLDQLGPDDRVGLVVYGSEARVLLEPTADLEAIRAAIGALAAGGSTNAEEGLVLGYDLAARFFREGAIHRIVLCSDGVANVGRTGPASILARIGDEAERGIELTTIGVGMGNYNDVLMEQLADRGDGNYAYVDDLAEARRVFVENLTGTLQTVAADAKAQVEFDPRTVSRYRLLGYENRDVADADFRDDRVDAGEIGAGHGVTALYEIKLEADPPRGAPLATLKLRYRSRESGEVVEQSLVVGQDEVEAAWEQAPRSLRLAALAAELAEILRGSYWAKEGDLDDVFRRAQRLSPEFPGDARVAELAALAGKAAELVRASGVNPRR